MVYFDPDGVAPILFIRIKPNLPYVYTAHFLIYDCFYLD